MAATGDGTNAWAQWLQRENKGCIPSLCLNVINPILCTNFPKSCGGCEYCQDTPIDKPVLEPVVPQKPIKPIKPAEEEKQPTRPKTREEIIGEVRVLAESYLQNAINLFGKKRTKKPIQTWFGKAAYADVPSREQVAHVLNSAQLVLSNAVYLIDDAAGPNTYGYVYPRSTYRTKDSAGRFKVFLCPLFFKSTLSVQVETLTHEATHHAVAYTNDVCADGTPVGLVPFKTLGGNRYPGEMVRWPSRSTPGKQYRGQILFPMPSKGHYMVNMDPASQCARTAYGRGTCEQLATSRPGKALANADNYCYYIQDATDDNPDSTKEATDAGL